MEEKIDIFDTIVKVFRDTLGQKNLKLSLDSSSADVGDWDSFFHIQIIVNIEQEFGVKFSIADIEEFRTIGDLLKIIEAKLEKK
tara:strand:+ start:402 stop:653 length:252 start_codon:yes stop_codon:yes gene_type:complete